MSADNIVSFESELLILVDKNDNELGWKSKAQCHDGDGILHRAFSIFIFDDNNRLLLQQRHGSKRLWPLYWSNSCCSHPRKGENNEIATQRRLKEELGFSAELTYLYKFEYHARFGEKGSEHELCSVYIGRHNSDPKVNPTEIAAWKWVTAGELDDELKNNPESYSPWFKMEWKEIREKYWDKVERL